MAAKSDSILFFGATGLIGTPIINELAEQLKAGTFRRVAAFTSQNTADTKGDIIKGLQNRGVEIFVGDVSNKNNIRSVLEGNSSPINPVKNTTPFDTVISAAGRNAILTQIPILEVAEQVQNVKRFYTSEYGTDIEHPKTNDKEPPHQLKLKVRAYVKEHIKRLEYTYLVTGPYSDLWLHKPPEAAPWVGGFNVQDKKAVVLYDGKTQISFTTMDDVARLLVASLLHPEESRNRALKVHSFTTTPLEVVAEFEKQTGGQKWQVEFVDREHLLKKEKEAYDEKSPLGTAHTLRKIWADGGTLYDAGYDNARIGFEGKEEGLEGQVKKAVEAQKGAA